MVKEIKKKKRIEEVELKVNELEKEFNKKLVAIGNESEVPVMFVTTSYASLNFKGSVYKNPVQIKVRVR